MHKLQYKIWFVSTFTLLRITLISLLYFQQSLELVGSGTKEELTMEVGLSFILICYMLTFYVGTVWEVIYEIVDFLKPNK